MGIVSDAGVHGMLEHLYGILRQAKADGLGAGQVYIHAFTDGRDTPPQSAGEDLTRLRAALPAGVPIATVSGRYYAMDRDKRWERVAKAYAAIAEATGPTFADAASVIEIGRAHV